MTLPDFHNILFNAHILFSLALGIWAGAMGIRNQSISGNFWGAVATLTIFSVVIVALGGLMNLLGYTHERALIYYLYMAWLVVIMPGLFSILRGRDDRHAAYAFMILCFFNATTSLSMAERHITLWVQP